MNLTSLYLSGLSMSAGNMPKTDFSLGNSKKGFDSYLSKANSTTEDRRYNETNNLKRATNKAASNQKDKKELVNNNSSNDEKSNKDDVKTSSKKEVSSKEENVSKKTSDASKVKEQDSNKENENEQNAIQNLSEALNVPVDKINEILQQLNMNINDLNDSNNLISFMQKITGAENISQLLSVDNIKDMFKSVKDILNDFNNQNNSNDMLTEVSTEQTSKEETTANNEAESQKGIKNISKRDIDSIGNLNEKPIANENNNTKVENNNNNVSNTQQVSAASKENFGQQSNLGNGQSSQLQNTEQILQAGNTLQDNIAKTFTESLSKAGVKKSVNSSDIINQIVDKLKAEVKNEISEIKITLKPEYLGDVSLKITSQNGIVTAQFTAESQRIKEIIEDNFNSLKDMLNEKGIEISELSVSVGNGESQKDTQKFMMNREKSNRRINNIIADSIDEEDIPESNNVNYMDDGQILETNVNYKA